MITAQSVHDTPPYHPNITSPFHTHSHQRPAYKASIARAAAPRRPTAWVAWGAPPVNGEGEAVGFMVIDPEGAAVPEGLGVGMGTGVPAAEDRALETAAATDEAAALALAAAEEAAGETAGRGAPASAHVFWTPWRTVWTSVAEQAFSMHGCTPAMRLEPFSQWHLKSVRGQPSCWSAGSRQLNCGMSVIDGQYLQANNIQRKEGGQRGPEQRQPRPER